jgi:hypothetical protein
VIHSTKDSLARAAGDEESVQTPPGGVWHVSSVANVLARANGCDHPLGEPRFRFYRREVGEQEMGGFSYDKIFDLTHAIHETGAGKSER